jgi:hypothetical protein
MKKIIFVMLICVMTLSVLFVPAFAAEQVEALADTGDIFGVVIAVLLASAMGVAALVAYKTRFVQEDAKKAGG